MTIKLGVRELVEFTLRTGDLSATSGSQNTAQLGARIHRRLQKQRDSNYQKNTILSCPWPSTIKTISFMVAQMALL